MLHTVQHLMRTHEWKYLSHAGQKEMDELIALLEAPKRIYIRIHSYELANEYVSFRTFSNGVWNIK